MKPYSSARTEGPQGDFILLDANENPYPPYPADGSTAEFNHYPDPQPWGLIERFARLFGVTPDHLFMARGADESIDLLVRAFCAAGRDSILITPPTFVMYETAAEIQGAGVVRVPLIQRKSFDLDVEGILAAHQDNPAIKLVFLCSPNNPTSNLMNPDDIKRIARELFGKALVIVDELYIDYSGQPSLASEVDAHPNLVVLRSMSKAFSLAGERIGITVANPEVIGILGRIMAPYSLTVSSVRAAIAVTSQEGMDYGRENIRIILAERDRIQERLQGLRSVTNIFPSDANFLLIQTVDAKRLTAVMLKHGIKIRDRSGVVDNAVRISVGTPEQNDAMLNAFEEYESEVSA